MRNQEISFVNVVLCILVMWIHICSVAVMGLPKESISFFTIYVSWRLSAFVVQAFLFLSALKLFLSKKEITYSRFLWRRGKKIGLPYMIAVLISYMGLIHLDYYVFDGKFLLQSLFLGDMISPFYFVVIVFQFYILFPIWKWVVKHFPMCAVIVGAVLCNRIFLGYLPQIIRIVSPDTTFAYNDRVFTSYLLYWILGCYAGKYYDCFLQKIKQYGVWICICFVVTAIVNVFLSYGIKREFFRVGFLEDVHMLYVLCAILFLFWLAEMGGKKCLRFSLFQGIDGLSFYLYLYHGILLYYIQDRCLVNVLDLTTAVFWRAICCYGVTAVVALVFVFWKRRRQT